MKQLEKVVADIRALRVQGAQNIALAAVKAIAEYVRDHSELSQKEFIRALGLLESARPTEPALRNALQYFIMCDGRDDPLGAAKKVKKYFSDAEKIIGKHVASLVEKEKQYFTHCHSSSVTHSLIYAFKKKRFSVANTETRPLFQGRQTALELSRAGIPVTHSVDSAGRLLIKDSAAIFLGCDAILANGTVVNKIGSELFAEVAVPRKIPVYIITHALKFSGKTARGHEEEIEERSFQEVWKNAPSDIHVLNYAFERIASRNIAGIISELGVLRPTAFVRTVMKHYPWIIDEKK